MKCPVCSNEMTGMVCEKCSFDESMNYEKYPTLTVHQIKVESISAKIHNYRSPWEIENISFLYKHELLLTYALQGVGKAQKDLAEFCFDNDDTDRFLYWKKQAESNGYKVERPKSEISAIAPKKLGYGICAGFYNTVMIYPDGKCDSTITVGVFDSYDSKQVSDWTDIISVSVGFNHTVGLRKDGTVVSTKIGEQLSADYGQTNVSDWTDIIDVAVGDNFTIGLKNDGSIRFCGENPSKHCDFSSWVDLIAISASCDHILGLKKDGTVVACGSNKHQKCDVSDWTGIIAVSAGYNNSVGLKKDGTVVSNKSFWTYNSFKLQSWKDIKAISVGAYHVVGLKTDGTVVACGSNTYDKCEVSNWTDIVAISAGFNHTVGLKSNGRIVATGSNSWGQCNVV